MKKLVILVSLMTILKEASAQDILGKWYGISRNRLAELIISEDSVRMQMVDPTRSDIGYERGAIKHFGIYNSGNKKVIIVENNANKGRTQYRAMTFFNIQKDSSIELAANGFAGATETITELKDKIDTDTATLFGNVFYCQEKIREFEKLKDIETMSVHDFKIYLKKFLERRDKYSSREHLMIGTFHDQIVNRTLVEMGYNPIHRNKWENVFFEKYLMDKEVEELYRKIF